MMDRRPSLPVLLIVGAMALLAAWPAGAAERQRSPREGWTFAFRDFVIAAWSPPAATDAEYRVYREAGFNLVMSPRYALPGKSLDLAQKHGLKVMIDTYTPNAQPWGGTAGPHRPQEAVVALLSDRHQLPLRGHKRQEGVCHGSAKTACLHRSRN